MPARPATGMQCRADSQPASQERRYSRARGRQARRLKRRVKEGMTVRKAFDERLCFLSFSVAPHCVSFCSRSSAALLSSTYGSERAEGTERTNHRSGTRRAGDTAWRTLPAAAERPPVPHPRSVRGHSPWPRPCLPASLREGLGP